MHNDIEMILLDSSELEKITDTLAERINSDYKDKNLLLLCILKGSIVFTADLMRKLHIPCRLDFMQVSSYGGSTVSSNQLKILKDVSCPIDNFDVLIVEDIIDSGFTLGCLGKYLEDKGVKSVDICTLLSKPSRREYEVDVKYIGEEIPDYFVVGYGLDFAEKYRALPYIGVLKPQVYENKEV